MGPMGERDPKGSSLSSERGQDRPRFRRAQIRRGRIGEAARDTCSCLPLGGCVLAYILDAELKASQRAHEERRSRSPALDVDRLLGLDHEQGRDAAVLEIPRRAAPGRDGEPEQGRRDRPQLEIAAEHRVRASFGVEGDEGKRAPEKGCEVGLGESRDQDGGKGGAEAPRHYLARCALRKRRICFSESSCAAGLYWIVAPMLRRASGTKTMPRTSAPSKWCLASG